MSSKFHSFYKHVCYVARSIYFNWSIYEFLKFKNAVLRKIVHIIIYKDIYAVNGRFHFLYLPNTL